MYVRIFYLYFAIFNNKLKISRPSIIILHSKVYYGHMSFCYVLFSLAIAYSFSYSVYTNRRVHFTNVCVCVFQVDTSIASVISVLRV